MHWISEKDEGMYGAVNKGFKRANVDIYAWLNSIDMYLLGAFNTISNVFEKYRETQRVKGVISYITQTLVIYKTGSCGLYAQEWIQEGAYGRSEYFVQQKSVFWRSELWNRVSEIDPALKLVQKEYRLPKQYIFCPARAWPHKNHGILVKAVGEIRKHGIEIQLVFTDGGTPHGKKISCLIEELDLTNQVRFLGRTSPFHMGALYRLCRAVVVPSLFEQNSGPMLEAMHFGKAVAVSRLVELVETVGSEGLVFDENSVAETAAVLERLWCSDSERMRLEALSVKRSSELGWGRFRECYQHAYEYACSHG